MVSPLAAPLSPRSVAASWQASSASSDPDSPYECPAAFKDRLARARPEPRRGNAPRCVQGSSVTQLCGAVVMRSSQGSDFQLAVAGGLGLLGTGGSSGQG